MLSRNPHWFPRLSRLPLLAVIALPLALGACDDGPSAEDAAGYLASARDHLAQHEHKAALIEIKNALQADPDNGTARALLGKVYLGLGDPWKAADELRRARNAGLDAAFWIEPLGHALLSTGREDEAQLAAEEVPADAPPAVRADALVIKARVALADNRPKAASDLVEQALVQDPGHATAKVVMGRLALAEGDSEAAHSLLDQALDAAPENIYALSLAGDLAMAEGDGTAAEQAYSEITRLHPYNPFPKVSLSQAKLQSGKVKEAASLLDEALQVAPDYTPAIYLRAVAAYRGGDYRTADQFASDALALAPTDARNQFIAGLAKFRMGEIEQAVRLLEGLPEELGGNNLAKVAYGAALLRMGRGIDSLKVLGPIADGATGSADLLRLAAAAAASAGELETARDYLVKAVKLRPNDDELLIALGRLELQLGNIEEGMRHLRMALEQDPNSDQALIMLFAAMLRKGEIEEAEELARRVQDERRNESIGFVMEGMVTLAKGEPEQARAAFNEALELDPKATDAAKNLATLAMQTNDLDLAEEVLINALDQAPEETELMLRLASVAARRDDEERVRYWLEKAVETGPENIVARVALARFHLARKRPEVALSTLLDILRDHPRDPRLLRTTGQAHLLAGQFSRAAERFRVLTDVAPTPDNRYLLATAYLNLDDTQALEETLDSLHQDAPDHLPTQVALAALKIEKGQLEQAKPLVETLAETYPDHPDVIRLRARLASRTEGGEAVALDILRQNAEGTESQDRGLVLELADAEWKSGNETNKKSSVERLRAWVNDNPDDVDARMRLGSRQISARDLPDAKETFSHVVAIQPWNWIARNNLAWILLKLGNTDEALAQIRKARESGGGNQPALVDTEGLILLAQGNHTEAADLFRQALELSGGEAVYSLHLADALTQSGERDRAAAMLRELLNRDDLQERAEAEQMLSALEGS